METTKSTEATEPVLWKAIHVALYLNISRSQVYEWAREGVLPSICLAPRVVRFDPDAIRDWANKRTSGGESVA